MRITLKPMGMTHAMFMLLLKNYPETRKFSLTSKGEIKAEDHYRWLASNIQYFKIILYGPYIIGAIRIQSGEISIWIQRNYWGLGLATKVLKKVAKPGMVAKIVEGNVGSMKAFINAGFKPIDHNSIMSFYTFQK